MITTLLLDYGGTIDTDGVHWGELFWKKYKQFDVGVTEQAFRQAYIFGEKSLALHPLVKPVHNFREVLNIKLTQQFSFLIENGYLDAEKSGEALATEIADDCNRFVEATIEKNRSVLMALAARYRLILVSNFYGNIGQVLTHYGIRSLFSEIVESAVVGVRKPDPAIFSLGVAAAGAEPAQCVVIGDSYRKDIVPGKAAGCRTVWLRSAGWEEDPSDPVAADDIIDQFSDLSLLLLPDKDLTIS